MNFLAHLWLAERSGTSLSGAILGDMVRGSDLSAYPPGLQQGIRIHRRIDAATDRHPAVVAARAALPRDLRRYAGILLDLAGDHVLAMHWPSYAPGSLRDFADRAAAALAADTEWFVHAGGWRPVAADFARLLQSYAQPAGMEHAVRRTAERLRDPAPLLAAGAYWRDAVRAIEPSLPQLLDDLAEVALEPRVAVRADIPGMQRVRASVRENPLTSQSLGEADYIEHLEGAGRGWVAEQAGEVIGFAMARADTGNVWALFVDPGHEGRGHGRRLHGAMLGWLRQQGGAVPWLTTSPGTRAERFYETAGWRRAGVSASGEVRFEFPTA